MNKLLVFLLLIAFSCAVFAGGEPLEVLWERPLIKGADGIQVLDFSGDGVPEVYVTSYSSKTSFLSSFNVNGSLLWEDVIPKFSFSAYPTEETKFVRVVNLDGDGYVDLIVGGEAVAPSVNYHPLYLAEREPEKGIGVMRFQLRWTYDRSDLTTSAGLSDYYGNGSLYVVTSSSDFRVYVFSGGGEVERMYDSGSSVWDVSTVNADEDPRKEAVAGTFEGVVYVDNDTRQWLHKTDERVIKVSALDLNSDGVPEFLGATRFGIYALNKDGGVLWERRIEDLTSSLAVGDLEADGVVDIVFGSGNKLVVLDGSGKPKIEKTFVGRVSSVGVFDADRDGVLEVAVGLNDRVMLIKPSSSHVKEERAVRHYETAVGYYSVGEIKRAVQELEEALRLYGELGLKEEAGNLTSLLESYKSNLALEERIKEAFLYLNLSRSHYAADRLDNSSYYSVRARELFTELNNSYGVMEAQDLIVKVEDRKKADALLDEAERLYVSGVFEEAVHKAREANTLYVKLNNTLGIKKSNSVAALSEGMLKTTTVSETTVPTTTLTYTTTLRIKRDEWSWRKYVIYVSLALIAFTAYHLINTMTKLRKKNVI